MKFKEIVKLQKDYGYWYYQLLINTGNAWKLEGSIGRECMNLLEIGACMLPKEIHYDYYGNKIPSRNLVKQGTKGSYQNSVKFYENIEFYSI